MFKYPPIIISFIQQLMHLFSFYVKLCVPSYLIMYLSLSITIWGLNPDGTKINQSINQSINQYTDSKWEKCSILQTIKPMFLLLILVQSFHSQKIILTKHLNIEKKKIYLYSLFIIQFPHIVHSFVTTVYAAFLRLTNCMYFITLYDCFSYDHTTNQ